MGLFDFWRKKNRFDEMDEFGERNSFPNNNNDSGNENRYADNSVEVDSIEEKKKKFAKRISDLIGKIDELSVQVYHIQQRVEVLEKKLKVSGGRE